MGLKEGIEQDDVHFQIIFDHKSCFVYEKYFNPKPLDICLILDICV
jgi:hypothetical protein